MNNSQINGEQPEGVSVCQVAMGALGKGTQTKEMTEEAPVCGDGAAVDVEAGTAATGRGHLSRDGRMREGDTGHQGWGRSF